MKERPILFSTPMVEAILKGTKTMTRRNIKGMALKWLNDEFSPEFVSDVENKLCPYGQVGDVLWVREKWKHNEVPTGWKYHYYAGAEEIYTYKDNERWKPSIHMPKEACRIRLKILDIRAERLHDMPVDDILKEGVNNGVSNPLMGARWENMQRMAWEELWKNINGKESWDSNPWVWVISFEQIKK